MKFRWKLLAIFLPITLMPILMGRVLAVHTMKNLSDSLLAQLRDNQIEQATHRFRLLVGFSSDTLRQSRETVELALDFQAYEIEKALSLPAREPDAINWSNEMNNGDRMPADSNPSAYHFRTGADRKLELLHVSYSAQVFDTAPGVRTSSVIGDISRLQKMTPVYRDINSHFQARLYWQQTGLENGLFASYPAHNGLPEKFDVRRQLWYRQALTKPVPWSDPYIDPSTRQVFIAAMKAVHRPDGSVAGVTALAFPVDILLGSDLLLKNLPPNTESFMVYLKEDSGTGESGVRIFARQEHTEISHNSWRAQLEPEWLVSSDKDAFNSMVEDFKEGLGNVRRMPFNGRDSLWVYGSTRNGAFLVLVSPYEEIVRPAMIANDQVKKRIDYLLHATGIGFGVVVALVVILSSWFASTVTRPMQELVKGARRLGKGDFSVRVNIRSRDEFGDMGRVFNMVVPQLKEHYETQQHLSFANEVQQNLMPRSAPAVEGLDISGEIIYCDKTGGDYFDYLTDASTAHEKVVVVVGDVSDHGIPSALLMTTARAMIRQRSAEKGTISQIVSDVNRQLNRDVEESGQFMSLFYCEIDTRQMSLRWVRAGHEPAQVYDSESDSFEELYGDGLPLGVFEQAGFQENRRSIKNGQVIIFATDGIWESRNADGEMFGKENLRNVIRKNAEKTAKEIRTALIDAAAEFRRPMDQDDDITLVVVKVTGKNRLADSR